MSRFYILEGREIVPCDDVLTWAAWFEVTANRVVAQDELAGVRVSTVCTGLPRAADLVSGGTPRVFETKIFGGRHDGLELHAATYDEAVQAHAHMVNLLALGDA